ncbi:MAG: GxxExxY protein [bacterium]|nr:GxxExxY protein [bacterium]
MSTNILIKNKLVGAKVIYPELSYKIVGILFEVHTQLGNRYQEKYYQRAVEVKLKNKKTDYKREIAVDLTIDGEKIGKYFLDFLIDSKVILELKAKPRFTINDYRQIRAYLKSKDLKLGILANFYGESLEYKRILNSDKLE